LWRDGSKAARCTVARLMRDMGLSGVIRGKPVRTIPAMSDFAAMLPCDPASDGFKAPARVADWTLGMSGVV